MREILTEWRALPATAPAVRSFARTVGTVLVGIAAFVAWRRGWQVDGLPTGLATGGVSLALVGSVAPQLVGPLYRAWMGVAVVLGFVMTRVVLTLVYALVVTPIGLVRRALGHDSLRQSWPALPGSTGWQPHETPDDPRAALERPF